MLLVPKAYNFKVKRFEFELKLFVHSHVELFMFWYEQPPGIGIRFNVDVAWSKSMTNDFVLQFLRQVEETEPNQRIIFIVICQ